MEDNLEKVYNDTNNWMYFEGETEYETIGVYCRCHCGRFLKRGKMLMNLIGEVKFEGSTCRIHGDVQPYFDRDCAG